MNRDLRGSLIRRIRELSSPLEPRRLRPPVRGPGGAPAELLQRLALEHELRVNPVWPMPDLRKILLHLRRSRVLGIVSNARFYTPLLFPALLREALSRLDGGFGIAPEETPFVGNHVENDIQPAGRAGSLTALFAGDRRSLRLEPGPPPVPPDRIVADLRRLLRLLPDA